MLKNFHLTLLIGPAVPVPAPRSVTDALTSVSVTSGGTRGGFQLTFAAGKKSPLTKTMLPVGLFDPMLTRVILVVTLGGVPNVIMDGVVTRQEVAPSNEAGGSTLTVTGEDLSVLMDVVERPMEYPAMPDEVQVLAALAPYLLFGIVPVVIPRLFPYVATPIERVYTQMSTDLDYVRAMARNVGYTFYIEPGPAPGANLAYWGPDIRIPVPQPALNVNMDAHTNVESLNFTLDGLAKTLTIMFVQDPVTKKIPIPVPVPELSILRPPLGARQALPAKVKIESGTHLSIPEAISKALGISLNSSDSVTATGSLNVLRYGRVLRSRQLVGVRGAGLAYDGLYYVNSVTHSIKRGEYKQNFQLSRDGLVSITPKVPV
jgi:hypothetical protein